MVPISVNFGSIWFIFVRFSSFSEKSHIFIWFIRFFSKMNPMEGQTLFFCCGNDDFEHFLGVLLKCVKFGSNWCIFVWFSSFVQKNWTFSLDLFFFYSKMNPTLLGTSEMNLFCHRNDDFEYFSAVLFKWINFGLNCCIFVWFPLFFKKKRTFTFDLQVFF
jgi:hypothetical protein